MKRFSILPLFGSIFAVFGIISILTGCDVIEPGERKQTGGVDTGTGVVKKVLIEDFTGFKCVNCPKAAEAAAQILDTYKDKVIVVSHHTGTFATPSSKQYSIDLRTPIGEELYPLFILSQEQPKGVVNRKTFSNSFEVNFTGWPAKVADGLTEKAAMTIELHPVFDTTTRILSVKVTVKYLQSGTKDQRLALYLIEDSIITYQKDNRVTPDDVANYAQRHVFRSDVGGSGAYGKQLSTAVIAAGTTLEETFTLNFTGKVWKPEHCAVVGFVNDGTTKEVLQVEEAKILGK